MIQDPRQNPDRLQNPIDSSLDNAPPLHKIYQNPSITCGDILFTRNDHTHTRHGVVRSRRSGWSASPANHYFPDCRTNNCRSTPAWLLSHDYNCDSTTIRLRYDDTTTHSTTTEVIEITIRLWYVYDKTTTKNWHLNFLLASNRVEWKQARAIRRSRIIVVS